MKDYLIIMATILFGAITLTAGITWVDFMWGLFPLERW